MTDPVPVPTPAARLPTRIGFLFNHDQLHQIAHSAPIAFELGRSGAAVEVELLASSERQLAHLETLAAGYPDARVRLRRLALGPIARRMAPLLDRGLPFSRVMTLVQHRDCFARLDLLVVPEKTSLLLRTRLGLRDLKFVHTRHGAGDRDVGFDRASGQFDLVLMSGPKIRDRLRARGLLREDGHAIVGYPKFDLHAQGPRLRLFDNDRPTVLYNPHFSPALSSWFRDGLAVLEAFRRSTRYNLIVAPHVMLFAKRLHIALPQRRAARPGTIPAIYRDAPNLHIDLGSTRSVDMSYLRAADLYLGDVSSQVYEFLHTPRPCLFLNSHGARWQGDDNYRHWTCGPVLDRADGLEAAVDAAFANPAEYLPIQQRLFADSFDLDGRPSALRACEAILGYIDRLRGG